MSEFNVHPNDLPLLIYRRLSNSLRSCSSPSERQAVIDAFLGDIDQNARTGRFLKMKLVLPDALKKSLAADEVELIEQRLAALRERRGTRLLSVYPLCADEFTLKPGIPGCLFRRPDRSAVQ